MNDDGTVANFPSNSALFKFRQKIKGSTENDGTKAVQIMEPLKYLGNFCRTLEKPLIYFEIILTLTWSANCVISKYSGESRYNICNN